MKILFLLGFCLLSIVTVLAKTVEYIPDKSTHRELRNRSVIDTDHDDVSGNVVHTELANGDFHDSDYESDKVVIPDMLQRKLNKKKASTEYDVTPEVRSLQIFASSEAPNVVAPDEAPIVVHTYTYSDPQLIWNVPGFLTFVSRRLYSYYRLWTTDERLAIEAPATTSFPELISMIQAKVRENRGLDRIHIEIERFGNLHELKKAINDYRGHIAGEVRSGLLQLSYHKYRGSIFNHSPVHVLGRYLPGSGGYHPPATHGWGLSHFGNSPTIYLFLSAVYPRSVSE